MSKFDTFGDSHQKHIKYECMEMHIRFERTSPTTGLIVWTLPKPVNGCEDLTYDGIVITVGTEPFKLENAPVNGETYVGDPNLDPNIFVGDKIGTSYVVFAEYGDKTTTSVEVQGLDPNKTYYVSGFPVDNVKVYCREGIHAYVLPYGTFDKDGPEPGRHVYEFTCDPSDPTNLDPSTVYTMKVTIDGDEYTISINGSAAPTYQQLIDEINRQFALLDNPPQSAGLPNVGVLYLNPDDNKIYLWDGSKYVEQDTLTFSFGPTAIPTNFLWFSPSTGELKGWTGTTWSSPYEYLTLAHDPNTLTDSDFWFNNLTNKGYKWNGTVWIEQQTFVDVNEPTAPPSLDPATHWYNPTTGELLAWENQQWVQVTDAILFDYDPNTISPGTYWFNLNDQKIYTWDGTTWNEDPTVIIDSTDPSPVAPGTKWYSTDDETLYEWNGTNWQVVQSVTHFHDPLVRTQGEIWWNTSNDTLWMWDQLNNTWKQITPFIQSDNDPSLPVVPEVNAVWYNPNSKEIAAWNGTAWVKVDGTIYSREPQQRNNGDFWLDTSNNEWYRWDGVSWQAIDVYVSDRDITSRQLNEYWVDTSGPSVQQWNGTTWIAVTYTTIDVTPSVGYYFFDTTANVLREWDGTQWIIKQPRARVIFDEDGNVRFESTNLIGGEGYIVVDREGLINALSDCLHWTKPIGAVDGVPPVPSTYQEGVGTDGTPDEVRRLIDFVRQRLGYPVVQVELTKQQIYDAVMFAIDTFRSLSSSAYKRKWYALYGIKGQHAYRLTNKKTGLDTIAFPIAIYRSRTGFFLGKTFTPFEQAFIQTLYKEGAYDLTTYFAYSSYIEDLQKFFAHNIVFDWDEFNRTIYLHQSPGDGEILLLECAAERSIQDLLTDRWTKVWIERFATAQAKLILGEIRSKYSTLPGAGGGTTLNGTELITNAKDEMLELREELKRNISNNAEEWGVAAHFVIG